MVTTVAPTNVHTLELVKDELISAPIDVVFETLLEQMGPFQGHPPDHPMPMVLEAWPGGRWYRDLGDNAGHLWGHVQVIKPPKLIEICGPLFMSYPAVSHLQYRLTIEGDATRLQFAHRAIGMISPEHAEGVSVGWGHFISQMTARAEAKAARE